MVCVCVFALNVPQTSYCSLSQNWKSNIIVRPSDIKVSHLAKASWKSTNQSGLNKNIFPAGSMHTNLTKDHAVRLPNTNTSITSSS